MHEVVHANKLLISCQGISAVISLQNGGISKNRIIKRAGIKEIEKQREKAWEKAQKNIS